MAGDNEMLLSALRNQRHHVLGTLEGLTAEQLSSPMLPSGWTALGLVQHLALDVERFWFQGVIAGDPAVWDSLSDQSAWEVPDGTNAKEVFDRYLAEAARSDYILTTTSLDQAPARWPDFFGDFRLADLHAVAVHVLVETACHTGHLDAARELLDGQQWLVLN